MRVVVVSLGSISDKSCICSRSYAIYKNDVGVVFRYLGRVDAGTERVAGIAAEHTRACVERVNLAFHNLSFSWMSKCLKFLTLVSLGTNLYIQYLSWYFNVFTNAFP